MTTYAQLRVKAAALISKKGATLLLHLYDQGTAPDPAKPWRITAGSTPTTTTTKGVRIPTQEGPPNYTFYIAGSATIPTIDERYVIEFDGQFYSIGAAIPMDPDGSGPIIWTLAAGQYPPVVTRRSLPTGIS